MPIYTTQNDIDASTPAGEIWRMEFATVIALAATGTYHIGVTIGNIPMRVLSRAYGSSESPITIELFEATFTLGANVRTLNRNLAITSAPPAQFVGGVTPGALGAVITSTTLRAQLAGGTSQVQLMADNNILITKRNTSYVIRLTNGGGANAQVGGSIDYSVLD